MKILFIHCAYQYKGGEDTVVEEEMKLLQQAGHSVQLLLFHNQGKTLSKVLQLPFNITSYRKTLKAINRYAPDVVHIHNFHFAASPSVIYAASKSKVPFVCTLHNYRLLCPSAILFHQGKPFLYSLDQKFPWKAVKDGVYKNSRLLTFWLALSVQIHNWLGTWKLPSRYIVLSVHAKKIFEQSKLKLQNGQLMVKPNFCSFPILSKKPRQGFLFVGRLSEEKGIPFLLQTFSRSFYPLTIAGDGPLKEEVIKYANKYAHIEYAGSLNKAEINNLMQRSAALIFPSIWYEGMPLTIIEAFANGLPVIATKLGAMEFMVTPGYDGQLFEAGNEEELSSVLVQWQSLSDAERNSFCQNARLTYEKLYTPAKNAEQLLHIYQSVQPKEKSIVNNADLTPVVDKPIAIK